MSVVDAPPGSAAEHKERAAAIRANVRAQNMAHYRLASALLPVFLSDLWKPAFRSFGDYATKNGLHVVFARRLVRVAYLFEEADIIEHGVQNLDIVASAPSDKRPWLLARLRAGATRDALRGLAAGRTEKPRERATIVQQFKVGMLKSEPALVSQESSRDVRANGPPCEASFDYGRVRFKVRVKADLEGALTIEHETLRRPSAER